MAHLNRREILALALAARLNASDSDFWNKKPPSDWSAEEIERLLKDSPWAKEIRPTYTSLPPNTDNRPWSENPPIGGVPGRARKVSTTVPYRSYRSTIRWESAEPIRQAQKIALPAAFRDHYVLGIFFRDAKDLGSKPIENLKESAVSVGRRAVDAEIVQVHPQMKEGFLVGFPKTSMSGVKQLEFSASVGRLALKARFNTGAMLYHGRLAL